ncbi:MAG: helix-turn-helix domain-containing protein [Acidobacteriota bacterium]|nr:helix-turn-helix domain-containing protein [Acidobacteriota bacterium]
MSERRTRPRASESGQIGRKQMTLELARAGKPPSEIADRLGVPFATVMSHLYGLVGEGALKRSDIVFSFDQDTRDAIELAIEERRTADSRALRKALVKQDVPIRREDLAVYLALRDARVALGDMYEMVRDAELALHDRIREAFVRKFGEEHWWREGVPANVRAECAALYEHDPEPAPDAFSYTSLIHLREILDKRWDVLAPAFPGAMQADRKKLMADLVTLNRIRNAVMHPVRRASFTDREFLFVREFLRRLRESETALEANTDEAAADPPSDD